VKIFLPIVFVFALLFMPGKCSAQIGTGTTPSDPIVAMSCEPTQVVKDIRASLAFLGRTDDGYWFTLAGHVTNPFGDGYYCGWNRYWEYRAEHPELSSGNRPDAKLPALHRDGGVVLPPTGEPPVQPQVVTDLTPILSALARIQASIDDAAAARERIFADDVAGRQELKTIAMGIDAKVQTIQTASTGPSVFGKVGGWLNSKPGMAVLGIIGTVVACRQSGKC
jgi:hypothetical protein